MIPFEWSMHGTCSGEGEGKGEGEGRVGLWSRNGMTARFRVGPCSWQGTSPVGRKAMRPPLSVRSDGTCGASGQIQRRWQRQTGAAAASRFRAPKPQNRHGHPLPLSRSRPLRASWQESSAPVLGGECPGQEAWPTSCGSAVELYHCTTGGNACNWLQRASLPRLRKREARVSTTYGGARVLEASATCMHACSGRAAGGAAGAADRLGSTSLRAPPQRPTLLFT